MFGWDGLGITFCCAGCTTRSISSIGTAPNKGSLPRTKAPVKQKRLPKSIRMGPTNGTCLMLPSAMVTDRFSNSSSCNSTAIVSVMLIINAPVSATQRVSRAVNSGFCGLLSSTVVSVNPIAGCFSYCKFKLFWPMKYIPFDCLIAAMYNRSKNKSYLCPWLVITPSAISMMRSDRLAKSSSWVTVMIVWPKSCVSF